MKFKLPHTLRASSLVEVLISMVILLLVFGIGLMIFTNLVRSSKSKQSQVVAHQMSILAQQAQLTLDEDHVEQIEKDNIYYTVEQDAHPEYSDRVRIKVTAHLSNDGKIIDSLVLIKEEEYAN